VALALLAVLGIVWSLWPPAARYRGWVDVKVSREGADGFADEVRLDDERLMPVRTGDHFYIEAEMEPAAYLYLFWVHPSCEVEPVYPWEPGKWGSRPQTEMPRSRLRLPEERGFVVDDDARGLETLVLLARPRPLTASDEEIRSWFAGLNALGKRPDDRTVVWFQNGKEVKDDPRFLRRFFPVDNQAGHSAMEQLRGLHRRLEPQGVFRASVSFARQGKE
jgi:hypothetical protein